VGVTCTFNRVGSMVCTFFTGEKVIDYKTATTSDTAKFATFFQKMLELGVYLAPSQFEAAFVALTHSDEDIQKTVEASYQAFSAVK